MLNQLILFRAAMTRPGDLQKPATMKQAHGKD